MRIRILGSLIAVLLSVPLFAQSNEVGAFANRTSFSSNSASDPSIGLVSANIKFDSKVGYGISFNHFLSPGFSVQLSAQMVRGDSKVEVTSGGVTFAEPGGTLDLKQYDAALHWYLVPKGTIKPYVGAGVAWMRSGKLKVAADPAEGVAAETISIQNKATWLADAGIDIAVSQEATITLAAKYTHYTANLNTTPDDLFQHLKLNPLAIAVGLRLRF